MEDLIVHFHQLVDAIQPQIAVIIATVIAAIATSIIDIRKKRKLKQLQSPTVNDTALELAKRALETVESAAKDCTEKIKILNEKYVDLEKKYHHQIEVNTIQAEQITSMKIELLYFRNQMGIMSHIDPEDHDPGFDHKDN